MYVPEESRHLVFDSLVGRPLEHFEVGVVVHVLRALVAFRPLVDHLLPLAGRLAGLALASSTPLLASSAAPRSEVDVLFTVRHLGRRSVADVT